MSDYAHLDPELLPLMALSDAERMLSLLETRWLPHPTAKHALKQLLKMFNTPKRPRMPNLLLVAPPFNGKTTVVRRFAELHGQVRQNEQGVTIRPVLLVEPPPRAAEKEMYCEVLRAFGAPHRATALAVQLRHQVIHLCQTCEVKMLIFDEFHSLLSGTPRQQRDMMNVLKYLCNSLAIPIVGAGTQDAVQALHTDPQHASRFSVLRMPLWKLDADFQRLLAGFEQILPLRKPSNLGAPESARLLHLISGGNLGDLHQLLRVCAEKAIESGKEQIDLSIIQAHRRWQRPTSGWNYQDISL